MVHRYAGRHTFGGAEAVICSERRETKTPRTIDAILMELSVNLVEGRRTFSLGVGRPPALAAE